MLLSGFSGSTRIGQAFTLHLPVFLCYSTFWQFICNYAFAAFLYECEAIYAALTWVRCGSLCFSFLITTLGLR